MVCLRYWETVLANPRVRNYLDKYRHQEVQGLEALLKESTRRHAKRRNGACTIENSNALLDRHLMHGSSVLTTIHM